MDDSAADWGDRRLHLAGYVMQARDWADFSDAWVAILNADPRVPYFKMSEARAGNDQATKIAPLSNLIGAYAPLSLEYSVSRADFKDLFSSNKKLRKLVTSPYFLCYFGSMMALVNLAKSAEPHDALTPQLKVGATDFIFDKQGAIIEIEAALWYQVIKLTMPFELRRFLGEMPRFEDDIVVKPLQAADMLASNLRRAADPFTSDKETAALLDVIKIRGRHLEHAITREEVISMANGVEFVADDIDAETSG